MSDRYSLIIRFLLLSFLCFFLANLQLYRVMLYLALYFGLYALVSLGLRRWLGENILFWGQRILDFVMVWVLIHFTGGRDSPFIFVLFLPSLETALTRDVRKTDLVALLSIFLLLYIFFHQGFHLDYRDWLAFFLYTGSIGVISFLALKLSDLREEIRQKEDIQRALLSSLSAGLLFLDPQFRLLSWNPRAREILGKMGPGQSLQEVLGEDFTPRPGRGELRFRDRVLGYSLFPLRREEEILGWGFLFQDITEIKKKEERLRQTEKLAYLGTMAAGLIHEIKNPLASISGGVQLLKEALDISPEYHRILEVISRESERLNRLVTNFLFFARPERGEREPFKLRDLLREILESSPSSFAGVRLLTKVPDEKIYENKEQWRQILENLLLNAVEASREKEEPLVELEIQIQPEEYFIRVKDNGPGIPAEVRPRLFEPFFTTKPGGTGLGLAVVYRIVENLKGDIKVLSEEGKGTVFEIKLPRRSPV